MKTFTLATLFGFASFACGQSNPANFSTVIDLGVGDVAPAIESDTQVNALDGFVGGFRIGRPEPVSNVEVNLLGGDIIGNLSVTSDVRVRAFRGTIATATISQGARLDVHDTNVGSLFLYDGAIGVLMGGSTDLIQTYAGNYQIKGGLHRGLSTYGSSVRVFGGDFELNGTPLSSGLVEVRSGDQFYGVLEDGSVFLNPTSTTTPTIRLNLIESPIPAASTEPIVITGPSAKAPKRLWGFARASRSPLQVG